MKTRLPMTVVEAAAASVAAAPLDAPGVRGSAGSPGGFGGMAGGVPLTARQIAAEVGMRLLAVFCFSIFVSGAIHEFIKQPSRLSIILLVLSETLTLTLAVCTRVPRERDTKPLAIVVSTCASFYFLAFSMASGVRLIPESIAVGLQIVGMIVQIGAKLTLRRSYGILPANRGVVVAGPYRFVRHPIYLGYFIYNLGFLLPSFGAQNFLVLLGLWSLQVVRIVREERILSNDAMYRDYMARVRFRLLPGVF